MTIFGLTRTIQSTQFAIWPAARAIVVHFTTAIQGFSSLHFHSLKGRFLCGMAEVADFHAPVFTAVDAIVLYFSICGHFPKLDVAGSSPVSRSIFSIVYA